MKRGVLFGYSFLLGVALTMQSCQDDPIVPNSGTGNGIDTTWVSDSTGNGNPIDSTWNGNSNGNGNGTPIDSTYNGGGNGNPIDSTYTGGGNGNPTDTTGGN